MANASVESVKRSYDAHVEKLKREQATEEEGLRLAIGGEFISVGKIERDLLISLGLQPHETVVDVGCGSGRLAYPLSHYLTNGRYYGFDVVTDLVDYARKLAKRPDWTFGVSDGAKIPVPDGTADYITFFSIFTHLLHEDSFHYLREAKRVLRPDGKIVFSFVEFSITCHWDIFQYALDHTPSSREHYQFMSRDGIQAWAKRLGLVVHGIYDGDKPHVPLTETVRWDNGNVMEGMGNLGQSVAVLTLPPATT